MDIVELLEKSANLVFCIAPFNKIVGDPGAKALHEMCELPPRADLCNFTQDFYR